MKHRHSNRIFGRKPHHRHALILDLTGAILKHNSIVTTKAKASELRGYIEPLITEAKSEPTLHRRRNLRKKVRTMVEVNQLFALGKAFEKRPGGYLRITKLPTKRHDQAEMARVDIISA